MQISWNEEKNEWLKKERGISFEMVKNAITEGHNILELPHPNIEKFSHQKLLLLKLKNYVYSVPCIHTEDSLFLKTIIPSRKFNKIFFHSL